MPPPGRTGVPYRAPFTPTDVIACRATAALPGRGRALSGKPRLRDWLRGTSGNSLLPEGTPLCELEWW